ncbi:MAG TPA: nuclear transport factor 2 family protein [Solirubrobacteraceae bacterium]|nr:nuclear transport factor 2 family protein [Solirubrobacteraceae bacterium]
MSRENVDVVMRGFEHFRATAEPLEEILAPDFVWDMSTFRGWPEQPLYEGFEGARAFLRDWGSAFDDWRVDVELVRDFGDKVVVVLRQHARAKTTGISLDMQFAQVFTVRDGLQARMQMYSDPAEALEAVGLPTDSTDSAATS